MFNEAYSQTTVYRVAASPSYSDFPLLYWEN